ncbi:hypothetical protein [Halomonas smyrnensis]|uniref:hypothetical protein n=1 Tax=Halomonas smyrnensis TaxID=720605 RepID=UPI0012E9C21D|nr:hypothetical protein [Halomonas smyrnensis]
MSSLVSHSIDVRSSEAISIILEGADINDFRMDMGVNYPDDHFDDQGITYRRLVSAAQMGDLDVCWVQVADLNASGEVNRDSVTGLFGWFDLSIGDKCWRSLRPSLVRLGIHRKEINRWLKRGCGYSEVDIPEAFKFPHSERSEDGDDNEGWDSWPAGTGRVKNNYIMKGSRQSDQDELVLKILGGLGYDPLRLPKFKPGSFWVKSEVKLKSESDYPKIFVKGSTIFEKSWDRLRKHGRIREEPAP